MPSPIGHTLAGCCFVAAATGRAPALATPGGAAALIAAANLPDLDFLGLLLGSPTTAVHQGATHSIAFVLVAAIALAWLPLGAGLRPQAWRWLAAAGLAHLALDLVNFDALPPIGIPLGWPLSDARWLSPVNLFPGSDRRHLLGANNLRELAAELAWLLPPLAVLSRRTLVRRLCRPAAGKKPAGAAAVGPQVAR